MTFGGGDKKIGQMIKILKCYLHFLNGLKKKKKNNSFKLSYHLKIRE